MLIENA
jgi:hypothetical protein